MIHHQNSSPSTVPQPPSAHAQPLPMPQQQDGIGGRVSPGAAAAAAAAAVMAADPVGVNPPPQQQPPSGWDDIAADGTGRRRVRRTKCGKKFEFELQLPHCTFAFCSRRGSRRGSSSSPRLVFRQRILPLLLQQQQAAVDPRAGGGQRRHRLRGIQAGLGREVPVLQPWQGDHLPTLLLQVKQTEIYINVFFSNRRV